MTREIAVEVMERVAVPPGFAFEFFRDVELESILTGTSLLPAVVSVDNPSGRWDEPGLERTLHLGDGNSLRERMTGVVAAQRFDYEIDRITGPLDRLVSGMSGRWSFEPSAASDASTIVHWRYAFRPRNALAFGPAWLIVRGFWRPYMGEVLARTVELATRAQKGPR